MAVVRKKQDDKILKTLRELVSIGGNKECFDCGQKGPTYINMTIGSFVCTTCSGILRGLTPPHRVKSISMATFTQEEIDFVRQNGNDTCNRTWLGLWDPKRAIKQEHRDFMIDKYERKRYYLEPASPLKSLPSNTTSSNNNGVSSSSNSSNSSSSINHSSKSGTENLVPLKNITLTPPTSLRLSRTNSNSSNGLSSHTSSSVTNSSTNIKFQQQFTPDDSNFFSEPPKILPPTPQKHSSNHHQRLNGTVGCGNTFERSQKNGLLTSTTSNGNNNNNNSMTNANKFTPDTDFVADFSNANIVNVNGTANASSDGLKANSNHKLSNGFNEKLGNGLPNGSSGQTNGEMENFADFEHNTIYNAAEHLNESFFGNGTNIDSSTTTSSNSTTSVNSINNDLFINNYSLLNHNNGGVGVNIGGSVDGSSIGSGGGIADLSNLKNAQFTAFGEYQTINAPNCYRGSPSYGANLASNGYSCLQNYHPSSGSSSLNYPTSNNNTNVQWNLWQQFNQWQPNEQPSMFGSMGSLSGNGQSQQSTAANVVVRRQQQHPQQQSHQQSEQQQHHCSNQNRWSLPISVNSKSGFGLSSATPSVDRYAALKDLDEQFREIKFESEVNIINNNTINGNGTSNGIHTKSDALQTCTANPFKTANPFQQQTHQQPQQQQQQQTLNWTIPGSTPPAVGTATNGFYATSPYQSSGHMQTHLLNGNPACNGVGFTNAFHSPMSNGYGQALPPAISQGLPQMNGVTVPNGLHPQPMNNIYRHFSNPFMSAGTTTAPSSNSNNPFL
ncbi:uncharacterized protein DDB_G0283357 isoform X2 [Toxorhynchites rutilus septentrionalis]|uniref:uncharacterized protein DDB_G0283357 isoform X2 n=1 Tax=Toxorhynchites rutilus septentrionalis TaxID=329112 RepID=UPI002479A403|nr:uncharacterized protein DDB_G0283357 isoform X2 [Toxorhynchites rutilus septentrionalis]